MVKHAQAKKTKTAAKTAKPVSRVKKTAAAKPKKTATSPAAKAAKKPAPAKGTDAKREAPRKVRIPDKDLKRFQDMQARWDARRKNWK